MILYLCLTCLFPRNIKYLAEILNIAALPQPAEDAGSVAAAGHETEPAPDARLGSQLKPQQTSPGFRVMARAGIISSYF